jgi:1-acyl-sn-glycerol-3-phosphate acyltransferase
MTMLADDPEQEGRFLSRKDRLTASLSAYVHARYEPVRRLLRAAIRVAAGLLVRLEQVEGREHVPAQGPAILYSNHLSMIDPVVVIHVLPRNIVPLAKIEAFDYPLIGLFPRLWNVIPVRRGEVDRQALRACLAVLQAGEILWIAPEGTRRPSLLEAKDGMAYLAVRSGAPLVPTAIDGTPGYPTLPFSRRWRQGGISIRFGRPFRFKANGRADRQQLAQMTREAMYQLAALLPPERRGTFADLSQATQETIEWL